MANGELRHRTGSASTPEPLPTSPFRSSELLRLPPEVREKQNGCPLFRFRTMVGDEAWMSAGYEETRNLIADPRLVRTHPDPVNAARTTNSVMINGTGDADIDAGIEHRYETVLRSLLGRSLTPRRMRALEPRVVELADRALDDMERAGRPADLTDTVARPLPMSVICELLGVPPEDRRSFAAWSDQVADPLDAEHSAVGMGELGAYMVDLLDRRAVDPRDDIMSDMARSRAEGEIDTPEAVATACGVLFAGHATTVVAIQWGVLHLLSRPDQQRLLVRDPSLVDAAVDEILRCGLSGGETLARYAATDLDVGDVVVRRGEAVVLNLVGANHDPRTFDDPDTFDVERSPNPHIAFGWGPRICIGRHVARLELRVLFGRLLARFPGLALACRWDDIEPHPNPVIGGVGGIPVTW